MIDFFSSWAKNLGLAIVIISILEMVIPNNKTKKYIRMVMGTYILFCIISPFIKSNINISEITNMENYIETQATSEVNQTLMDDRIKELYIKELEKDITKKIENKGYKVNKCTINVKITNNVDTTEINKIILKIEKDETKKVDDEKTNVQIEKKLVTEIQKIKQVDTKIETNSTNSENVKNTNNKLTQNDIQIIKKILKEEYEVSEKCLTIN